MDKRFIIIFVVVIFLLLVSVKSSAYQLTGSKIYNSENDLKKDFQKGLKEITKIYGPNVARLTEKMYRLETNNFTSD